MKRIRYELVWLLWASASPALAADNLCAPSAVATLKFDAVESARADARNRPYAAFIVDGPTSGQASIALNADELLPVFDATRARLYLRDSERGDWYSFDLASHAETSKWLVLGGSSKAVVYLDISGYLKQPAAALGKEFKLEVEDRAGCLIKSAAFRLELSTPASTSIKDPSAVH